MKRKTFKIEFNLTESEVCDCVSYYVNLQPEPNKVRITNKLIDHCVRLQLYSSGFSNIDCGDLSYSRDMDMDEKPELNSKIVRAVDKYFNK